MSYVNLTQSKIKILKTVNELSNNSEFGVAAVKDIIKARSDLSQNTIRKQLSELNKDKLIESPLRGCWRLTKQGKNILFSFIEGEKDER